MLAGTDWNRSPPDHLHRMGGYAALAGTAAARSARRTDRVDERIGVFTGATGPDRREEVKAAFNADPAKEPLRILICTDAAREGINLQTYCSDLIHLDLPWNPSRLEQRNGRIDRKLQPAEADRLPLFPLRAARGRHRAGSAGAQDRDDPRGARVGRSGHRGPNCPAAGGKRDRPGSGGGARQGDRGGERRRAARPLPRRNGRRGTRAARAVAAGAG